MSGFNTVLLELESSITWILILRLLISRARRVNGCMTIDRVANIAQKICPP